MDERIVPDAGPVAAPGPQAAAVVAPDENEDEVLSPGAMSNAELQERIDAIDRELQAEGGAAGALTVAIADAQANLAAAQAAMAAALTEQAQLVAMGRIQDSIKAIETLQKQLAEVERRIDVLQAERAALLEELIRRQQGGPGLPRDPVGVTEAGSAAPI